MQGWVIIPVIAIVASVALRMFQTIYGVQGRDRGGDSQLKSRVEALEQEMATVRGELVEAQERLDFTERLLAKQKDASRMGPG